MPSTAWLRRFRQPAGACALVCLPHAGGTAGMFRDWQRHTGELDIVGVELPGRAGRFTEPAARRMDELTGPLLAQLATLDGDYALFGHSLGALVGFELARRIHDDGGAPAPVGLFVSGCPTPGPAPTPPAHILPTPQLIDWMRRLGGLEDEILAQPELLEVLLPTLRADLAVYETYEYRPGPPLPWPIQVIAGDADAECRPADLDGWSALTIAGCRFETLPGGHFCVYDHIPRVVGLIEQRVTAIGRVRR